MYNPRRKIFACGSDHHRSMDAIAAIVYLWQAGAQFDCGPVIEAALPIIKKLKMLTRSELAILWAQKERLT